MGTFQRELNRKRKAGRDPKWYPDAAVIYDVENPDTVGESGSTDTVWTARDPESCRFYTLSGRELERAQQLAAEAEVVVAFPAFMQVPTSSRIVVTLKDTQEVLDVQVVFSPRPSFEAARKILGKVLNWP